MGLKKSLWIGAEGLQAELVAEVKRVLVILSWVAQLWLRNYLHSAQHPQAAQTGLWHRIYITGFWHDPILPPAKIPSNV